MKFAFWSLAGKASPSTPEGTSSGQGVRALVLELIEGPTLADRIAQGALPLDEALPIAKQIAEALEAAHEAGVIHRDLKPANIKVKPDGTVKVLDVGLAKALDPTPEGDPSLSPTLTAAATQMGVILGTAAYMSPEQARGKPVDKRADIWAFGVVLYEMLAGARPFQGEDVSLTLASVMKSDIDVRALPNEVTPAIRTVLDRCLEKEPRRRIRDIGDVRLAMEGGFETTLTAPHVEPTAAGPLVAPWQRPLSITGMVLAAAALTAVALSSWPTAPATAPDLVRFVVTPPDEAPIGFSGFDKDLAISADGTLVVYSSTTSDERDTQLTVHRLSDLESVALRGTLGGIAPFISPDDQWVGFVDSETEEIRRVSILGGPPQTLAELPTTLEVGAGQASSWSGASWGANDLIVAGTFGGGLFRIPLDGGPPEMLTEPDREGGEGSHNRPSVIPGHDAVLFNVRRNSGGELAALDLTTGEVTRLGLDGHTPYYVSSGHLVYAAEDGSIRAVGFDAASLEVTGTPAPLIEDAAIKGSGAADFSVSDDGRLVYISGRVIANNGPQTLIWLDHDGTPEPIALPPDLYREAKLSPSGNQVLLNIARQDNRDLWVSELTRNTLARVTTDPADDFSGTWLTDDRILFMSERDGAPGGELYARSADGTGAVAPVLVTDYQTFGFWTSAFDPERLIVTTGNPANVDVGFLTLGDDPEVQPLVASDAREVEGTVSPDGGWLAYSSDDTGAAEVYVQRFPDGGERQRVSNGGGRKPLWAPDGRTLYYVTQNRVMQVAVGTGSSFTSETPTELFQVGVRLEGRLRGIQDISPDGQRFLALVPPGGIDTPAPSSAGITVVLNWQQELLDRVPVR